MATQTRQPLQHPVRKLAWVLSFLSFLLPLLFAQGSVQVEKRMKPSRRFRRISNLSNHNATMPAPILAEPVASSSHAIDRNRSRDNENRRVQLSRVFPMPAYLFAKPEHYADLIASDTDPEAAPLLHAAAERLRNVRDQYQCSRVQLSQLTNIDLELLTIVELGIGNLETAHSVIDRVEERLEQIQKARTSQLGRKTNNRNMQSKDT